MVDKIFSERPWGKFTQYTQNEPTTIKIIDVLPEQRLSVQRHTMRDEYWVAIDEGLIATINGKIIPMFGKNSEVWIERGSIHTIENRGLFSARFLEISFGTFDENDIERLEDKYGRV